MSSPASKPQLLPLTSIRFFLALWVVLFHQCLPGAYMGSRMPGYPEPVFYLLRTGYIAVGVFFVLSGFILSYNYSLIQSWSRDQLVRFAVARFSRIYPVYAVGLVLVSPFVAVALLKDLSLHTLGKNAIQAILNWTLLQAWLPQTATSWNGPGWSLSNEAFFYCVFPFVGVALWRATRLRTLLVAGALIWAAAVIAPLTAVRVPVPGFGDASAALFQPKEDGFWAALVKFDPLLQLPQFCLGIVLGKAYDLLRRGRSRFLGRGHWLYLPGLILEAGAISHANSIPYPLAHNGVLLPLHGLVILGFALGGGPLTGLLSMKPLVFLGNASYAMYILHSAVGAWIDAVAKHVFSTELEGPGIMFVYVVVVIGLSSILYKLLEEPLNRILKRRIIPVLSKSQPLAPAGAVVVAGGRL